MIILYYFSKNSMSRTINKYKFKKLMNRQGGVCFYCLQKFSNERTKAWTIKKVTVDHVKPVSELKWLTVIEQNTMNTVLACYDCNVRKMNISAELFLQWYEWICVSPYDIQSEIIPIKTRSPRRWYHRYLTWK